MLLKIRLLLKWFSSIREFFESKRLVSTLISIQVALLVIDLFVLEIPTFYVVKQFFVQAFLLITLVLLRVSQSSPIVRIDISRIWSLIALVALGSTALCMGPRLDAMWDSTHFLMFFPSHNSAGFFFGAVTVLVCTLQSDRKGRKYALILAFTILLTLSGSRSSMVGVLLSLVVWLCINQRFRIRKDVLSVALVCLILLVNHIHPFYFSANKISDTSSSIVEKFVESPEKPTSGPALDESLTTEEITAERKRVGSRNIRLRLETWELIVSRPLGDLLLGEFNYQCDEKMRFIGNLWLLDEIMGEAEYDCGTDYIDMNGYGIMGYSHNAFLHILAKYGLWGLIFYAISAAFVLARLWPRGRKYRPANSSVFIFVYAVVYGIGTAGIFSFIGSVAVLSAAILHRIELIAEEK